MKLNKFAQKNFIQSRIIYRLIEKSFFKIQKLNIKCNENLIGFFFHELLVFSVSKVYQRNLKQNKEIRFGYRYRSHVLEKHHKERKSSKILMFFFEKISFFLRKKFIMALA